jgi:hypothetical protein
MPNIKRRSRMISVRVSEEEYAALRHLCSLTGARSISDLTRDSMRAIVNRVSQDDPHGGALEEFRAGMKILEKKIEQLEAKIMTSQIGGEMIENDRATLNLSNWSSLERKEDCGFDSANRENTGPGDSKG